MKLNKYMLFEKFNLFLAKRFGLVEYGGKYCIPSQWYVYDRDVEEDNIIEYEAVDGLQIFPIIKKVEEMPLCHDGLYRHYIKQFCKERK